VNRVEAGARAGHHIVVTVDQLAEDLVLLTLAAGRGSLSKAYPISYALMGAELVELAALGQVDIAGGRIVVRDPAPTGDPELDAALASIGESAEPPLAKEWVGRPRLWITRGYVERLEAAGWVTKADWKIILPRWRVTGVTRLAQARQRVDLIARSRGPADPGQFAYAGLVCVIGLDRRMYRGLGRNAERARLREVATGECTTVAGGEAGESVSETTMAALRGVTGQATTLAAVRAATDAAMHAAEAALADIAAHAGGHGGGGGGGHH
jgi:hypothetical protein